MENPKKQSQAKQTLHKIKYMSFKILENKFEKYCLEGAKSWNEIESNQDCIKKSESSFHPVDECGPSPNKWLIGDSSQTSNIFKERIKKRLNGNLMIDDK